LSPDGQRLAYNQIDPGSGKSDIWIRDLARNVSSRFTFRPGNNGVAVWAPDGKSIVFGSFAGNRSELYQKPATGQGEEVLLLAIDGPQVVPSSISPDGRLLAYTTPGKGTGLDIWAVPLTGEHTPAKVVATQFAETLPTFSPDGRFIAYRSNESGRQEIYVQTFPDPGGKWQVSVTGATDPQWRADSRELFFRATDQRLMAVDIQGGAGTFQAGAPRALFSMRTQAGSGLRNRYSVSKAGDRFITVAPQSREAIGPTTVVLNWDAALPR
jgi:Tol biopolymer transport system component